ncbi:T9SS type A sorting domain-containing protein [Cryomorphaceae bacterium]|nr:T9SS type A sorting domain-containing protein [Cryomorphaceae bacterium]
MKQSVLSLLLLVTFGVTAQQIDQVSVGAGYINQTYYSLSSGNTSASSLEAWDIGFNVNPSMASVFINEGVASGAGAQGPVSAWLTSASDFNTVTINDTVEYLRNPDVSWSEGAFNTPAAAGNPADFGWGVYDFVSHEVIGDRVFIIQLRNGSFKKFMVESLILGTFTFKWADLDGGNEITSTLDQTAYSKKIVFYSLANNAVVDIEPTSWDMMFTRFSQSLDAGDGTFLEYNVGGALIAPNVYVAQANGVDPSSVEFVDHEADLTDSIDVIGHDWRYFDLGSFSWITLSDRVYFVTTESDSLFQMQFIDFEGSSTGIITLEKEYLGQYVSTPEIEDLNGFAMYPNPASSNVNLTLDWADAGTEGSYRIVDLQGRIVAEESFRVETGYNKQAIQLDAAPGMYVVTMTVGTAQTTERLIIQ